MGSKAIGPPQHVSTTCHWGIICSEAGVSLVTNPIIVTNFMNFRKTTQNGKVWGTSNGPFRNCQS